MCNFASFVLTKDRVFWSDKSDSHTEIIKEHGLHEYGSRGMNIIRVEISPNPLMKVWPSFKSWKYKVDQDLLPDWHIPMTTEKRARAALARRFKAGFTTIDASGYAALTSLDAPVAKNIYADGCAALTSLDAPVATYIDASGCAALTSLDAPVATYIDASGCAALTSLDAPGPASRRPPASRRCPASRRHPASRRPPASRSTG